MSHSSFRRSNVLIPPPEDAFDTRPAAVQRWLEQLPLASTGRAVQQIYQILHECNRYSIPAARRYRLLVALAGPVHVLNQGLRKHFSGKPLPLPKKERMVARLSSELMTELVIGYRLILDTRPSLFDFVARLWIWRTAARHMLHYLGIVLCNYRHIGMAPPTGLWAEAHGLYLYAGKMGWLPRKTRSVADLPTDSIDDGYRQLLLLSLFSPQGFQPRQLEDIYAHVDEWGRYVQLRPTDDAAPGGAICVQLKSDHAPTVMDGHCKECKADPARLLLDISALNERLKMLLDGGAVTAEGVGRTLQPDTIRAMLDALARSAERREERQTTEGSVVRLLSGINHIHNYLVQELVAAGMDGCGTETDVAVSHQQASESDGWEVIYKPVEEVHQPWAGDEAGAMREPDVVAVVNVNSGGYCLHLPASTDVRMPAGVLLLVQPEGGSWSLGQARWIQDGGQGDLKLGVQILAAEPLPVRIRNATAAPTHWELNGILANTASSGIILVVPNLPPVHSGSLCLLHQGHEFTFQPGEQLAASPHFIAFRLTGLQATGEGTTPLFGGSMGERYAALWPTL